MTLSIFKAKSLLMITSRGRCGYIVFLQWLDGLQRLFLKSFVLMLLWIIQLKSSGNWSLVIPELPASAKASQECIKQGEKMKGTNTVLCHSWGSNQCVCCFSPLRAFRCWVLYNMQNLFFVEEIGNLLHVISASRDV